MASQDNPFQPTNQPPTGLPVRPRRRLGVFSIIFIVIATIVSFIIAFFCTCVACLGVGISIGRTTSWNPGNNSVIFGLFLCGVVAVVVCGLVARGFASLLGTKVPSVDGRSGSHVIRSHPSGPFQETNPTEFGEADTDVGLDVDSEADARGGDSEGDTL